MTEKVFLNQIVELCDRSGKATVDFLVLILNVSRWGILSAIRYGIHWHCGSRYMDRSSAEIHLDTLLCLGVRDCAVL